MKRAVMFYILASVLMSGCGLLEELQGTTSEAPDLASTPNGDIPSIASELLFADSDCLLPCFAGLYPGESSVEDVEEFVSQFDVDNEAVRLHQFERAYSFLSLFPEPSGLLLLGFVIEDDKLSFTTVGISSVHDWLSQIPYNLPDLFSTYGEPDEVFILIAGPPTRFELTMPYNEQGFMLRYSATYDDRELATNNEPLPICLNQEVVVEQIDLWLQSPDEAELIESLQPYLREDREYRPWWNIQRMANVTVAEFTDFFVSNPQGCFLIPSLAELREQGYVP